jgi:hypothetical protein
MNGDQICVVFSDAAGDEWCDWIEMIYPLSSSLAAKVWAYATRTLTQTAAQVAAILAGSEITAQRGDTLLVNLTGLGDLTGRTKLWFTVKSSRGHADSQATLMVEETAGLTVVNGAAYAATTDGEIDVTDEAEGDLTITVAEDVTDDLIPSAYFFDIQMLAGGVVTTLTEGSLTVNADITRAIA